MNRSHILLRGLSASLALLTAGAAAHAATPEPAGHRAEPAAAAADPSLADGEVRKVDVANGKLTIRHGPLAELGMDAMTMVFRAGDPAMLERVRTGDRIRFRAKRVDGVLTVTEMTPMAAAN